MKYVAMREPGGPDVLYVDEAPRPHAGPGEVLIEVEAAGVARPDALQRQGKYPPPKDASPILGLEVAGTIVDKGADTHRFAVGDRVVALCNGGGYAAEVAVPEGQVLPLPPSWSFIDGASLPENMFTVYDNLFVRARLTAGETVLVHGGTSGIGSTAIQCAVAIGADVISTAGSEEKCRAMLEMGARAAINYRTSDFVERVMALTDGRGVDVVLDIVGGDYVDRDLRALATDGRIACLATAGGAVAAIDLRYLLSRRATILGSSLRPRSREEKAAIARGLERDIWPRLRERGAIRPLVDSVFSFADASKAHARLESSSHIGKIVLVPDPPGPTA
ncbi:MAG TPA: NAD(P)H-quinone oxidoreductase [Candidatus Aquilonibacter sp.]|nr:NAD(P)H-quinone oxidoreductase [Candidatus Aquilonibacter sp.]